MSPQCINILFLRLAQQNPNPTTELIFSNEFQLLFAVILSAQSTDKQVNKVTNLLFTQIKQPLDVLNFGRERLKESLKSLGLYQNKAEYIWQTAQQLIHQFGGHVPSTREELETLPGVGRKTANVVLNTVFNQPTIAVDTHLFRVAHRLGLSKAKTPLGVERDLLAIIPKAYLKNAHHWLILHGRYTCKARNPICSSCLLTDLCPSSKLHV
jgi:endonuclease-3